MDKYYTLHVAGLTRELPLCPVNEHLDIAAFVMFSDVELTIACATELNKIAPDHDVIITAESKAYRWPTRCRASPARSISLRANRQSCI
jgi:adenine phosphoribosyltransferase